MSVRCEATLLAVLAFISLFGRMGCQEGALEGEFVNFCGRDTVNSKYVKELWSEAFDVNNIMGLHTNRFQLINKQMLT